MTSFIEPLSVTFLTIFAISLLLRWRKVSQAPGPFLAGVTDLWRAYYQYRGLLRSKLLQLHKEYGSVVRYGINSINISDPSAINIVYGSRVGFVTVGLLMPSHKTTR
jgi:hypothetical protein